MSSRRTLVSLFHFLYYTPPYDSGGVLWYHVGCPCVRPFVVRTSVRPYFCFRTITWVIVYGFSPNSVCALILWRSGLGLLMGKFYQFLTELSARDTSVFSFPDDNLSKYQWIFTKLGVRTDIVETWFGIADRKIPSSFDSYLPATRPYFYWGLVNINGVICPQYICFCQFFFFTVRTITWVNLDGFFTNFDMCIYVVEICFLYEWLDDKTCHQIYTVKLRY